MKSRSIGYIINFMLLGLVGFITVYPFIYILSLSLSNYAAVSAGKVFLWPIGFNLEAYKNILMDKRITIGFYNSFIYTLTGTGLSVFLTSLTAYPLADGKVKYRRFLMRLVIIAMLFSGGLIPSYLLIKQLGMIDTIWALIIPGVISPFNLILTKTFIQELPGELFESAIIDGATQPRIFVQIVLPLSMPIISTITLYYAVGMWNSYFTPMLYLNDDKKYPLQVFLRQIVIISQMNETETRGNIRGNKSVLSESIKSAALVISTVPILVFYPFLQKHFVKGILIGAIKG